MSSQKKEHYNIDPDLMYDSADKRIIGGEIYRNKDWTTREYVIPRNMLYRTFPYEALTYNCIYLLIGQKDGEHTKIYVGQAKTRNNGESVIARLREHDKSEEEPYNQEWDTAVVFTSISKDDKWTADDINALEYLIYTMIPDDIRLNRNTPNSAGANFKDYEGKLRHINAYLVALGYDELEDSDSEESESIAVKEDLVINIIDEDDNYKENDAIYEGSKDLHEKKSRIPEVITPPKVVAEMVSILPQDVWNDQTRFIDISCKGGEFLRAIYDRLMNTPSIKDKYDGDVVALSNDIIRKQLFGIALSQQSYKRTMCKLKKPPAANIHLIWNFADKLKGIYGTKKNGDIHKLIEKEFGTDMKFNVVIGNPPYQDASTSIYPYFIEAALDLAPRVCMIVKNNFLASNTIAPVRKKMIEAGMTDIYNYPKMHELFKGMDVTVAIFNIDPILYNGETTYREIVSGKTVYQYTATLDPDTAILSNTIENSIYNKIYRYARQSSFSKYILPDEPFRINSNGNVGRGTSTYAIKEQETRDDAHSVELIYMDSSKNLYTRYIRPEDVPNRAELVDTYKVIMGARMASNSSVLTNVRFVESHSVTSASWGVLYTDTDRDRTLAVEKYCKTKFFRCLVRFLCSRGGLTSISPYRFSLVPDQDFSSQSDIDWSKSISDIDQQLYAKYGLSSDETKYIESTISEYKEKEKSNIRYVNRW